MNHDLETTFDGQQYSHTCKRCGATRTTPAGKPNWVGKCSAAKGLGDYVEAVAKFFGFKKCGACEKRKQWLNRLTS
jgi:hypothetical protein